MRRRRSARRTRPGILRQPERELLEERRREARAHPGHPPEGLGGVVGLRGGQGGRPAQALLAEQRQVDRRGRGRSAPRSCRCWRWPSRGGCAARASGASGRTRACPSRSTVAPTRRPGIRRTSSFRQENSPRYGPPKFRWFPSPWPSPTTMSAPASPGGRSSARATGSTLTTRSAPRSWAIAAAWSRSSRQPKKFGYWTMTHAVLPVTALRRASRSVTPSAHGTLFTGRRGPRAVGLHHPPGQRRQRARRPRSAPARSRRAP